MAGEACSVCGVLPAHVSVDLKAGQTLPAAADELRALGDGRVRRCSACGACFGFEYEYEYGALGDGWETATLKRIEPSEARARLVDCAPTDQLASDLRAIGAADDPASIVQRLNRELGGKQHATAIRKLLHAHFGREDWMAVAELLHHANPKVREDTLYLLSNSASSLRFRAVNAPAAKSHDRAMLDPSMELRRELVACLCDPDERVRWQAAVAFANDWRSGGRPPFDLVEEALKMLREAKVSSRSQGVRAVVESALAAGNGIRGSE